MRAHTGPRRLERGSATVEVVLVAPVFCALLALVVLAGRMGASHADVDGVAHSAARQITLSRDPLRAIAAARADAAAALHEGAATCRHLGWEVSLSAEFVRVTVSCEVDLSAAALLPVPGTLTVTGHSTEALDRYREAS